MFATRMRLVAATVALVATAPLAALGTANAESAGQAKPERKITIVGKEPKQGKFIIKGTVKPGYENRSAVVERKLKSQNKWNNFRKFKTNGQSKYRQRIAALNRVGVVCYRVKIKGNDTFKTSYSRRVCIQTTRG
jgi:hypothetical protein